jgi:hypothetical protein
LHVFFISFEVVDIENKQNKSGVREFLHLFHCKRAFNLILRESVGGKLEGSISFAGKQATEKLSSCELRSSRGTAVSGTKGLVM